MVFIVLKMITIAQMPERFHQRNERGFSGSHDLV